jgi:hypothetical protein
MAGRRGSNLRSGDLAEDLGILLLKGVAAVAEVQRQEDVGLDAVATLLRPDDDRNCYAEDTFVVQLKAESVPHVEYAADHAFKWFVQQSLPMFIGRVSLSDASIELYPTIFANQAIWSLHSESVKMHFGNSSLPPALREQLRLPWTLLKGTDTAAEVWLGEPVLRWTVSDLKKPGWAQDAYAVLKRFVPLIRREMELLSFGQSSVLKWATNDPESIKSFTGMMKSQNLKEIAEQATPALQALMLHTMGVGGVAGEQMMRCLIEFAAELRKAGIEIDPEKMFRGLFTVLKAGNSTASGPEAPES